MTASKKPASKKTSKPKASKPVAESKPATIDPAIIALVTKAPWEEPLDAPAASSEDEHPTNLPPAVYGRVLREHMAPALLFFGEGEPGNPEEGRPLREQDFHLVRSKVSPMWFSKDASVALTNTRLLDSSDQRHLLAARLLLASMEAGIVTAVEMLGAKEPQTNTLTAMGDAVSREVRRLLLLEVLEKNHWNLSKTAIDLRITAGAPAVSRLIRDLGLSDAYKSAKATGKVDPRGRRPT